MEHIRNKWLKSLGHATATGSASAASDMIVVDIGMVVLVFIFTLCALPIVSVIWVVEILWKNRTLLKQWYQTMALRSFWASRRFSRPQCTLNRSEGEMLSKN